MMASACVGESFAPTLNPRVITHEIPTCDVRLQIIVPPLADLRCDSMHDTLQKVIKRAGEQEFWVAF